MRNKSIWNLVLTLPEFIVYNDFNNTFDDVLQYIYKITLPLLDASVTV